MPAEELALPKVVFDCNVFLQALVNPHGPAGRCKQLVDRSELELYVSEEVLREVTEVLSRPSHKRLMPTLTLELVEAFLADVQLKAICLKNVPEEYRFERDPKDACYLNLAIVANARFIVSRDNDLLDLMKPTTETASAFQQRYPFLKIITPLDLLLIVETK
ncbi:MAG: putative toxin-antitoxin system toxin component, PIN family [Acidobacteria bacterium]|nr:putative toxin-antitoxin system toxin component, PIN family [Acidobacteriota bacterium]